VAKGTRQSARRRDQVQFRQSRESTCRRAETPSRAAPVRIEVMGIRYTCSILSGGMTLIADEPVRDCVYSGIPRWSYDAVGCLRTPREISGGPARLMAIEARDGRPTFSDLGAGNFPTISPDDKWIAFLALSRRGAERGGWRVADACRRLGAALDRRIRSPLLVSDGRQFPD